MAGVTKLVRSRSPRWRSGRLRAFGNAAGHGRRRRVILVKLADRLHNMRTLEHLPEDRRAQIAQETRDIYAPIANRLGMSKVRNELEELAFRHLEPEAYESLRIKVDGRRRATEGLLEDLRQTIASKLTEARCRLSSSKDAPSACTASTRSSSGSGSAWSKSTISRRFGSLPTRSRTATQRWASFITLGRRSLDGSRTSSRCPGPTGISRCTRPS